jgi:hypothetical protein
LSIEKLFTKYWKKGLPPDIQLPMSTTYTKNETFDNVLTIARRLYQTASDIKKNKSGENEALRRKIKELEHENKKKSSKPGMVAMAEEMSSIKEMVVAVGHQLIPGQTNDTLGKGPCFKYARGECRNGNSCRWIHDPDVPIQPQKQFNRAPRRQNNQPQPQQYVQPQQLAQPQPPPPQQFAPPQPVAPPQPQQQPPTVLFPPITAPPMPPPAIPAQFALPTLPRPPGFGPTRGPSEGVIAKLKELGLPPNSCLDFAKGRCTRGPKCKFSHGVGN